VRFAAAAVVALALAPAAGAVLPRATADRPDEVSGPQIHFVYAVPSDGTDRALDTSGAIDASVTIFLRWLSDQTGGRTLRTDTYQGSLDVTFVRLPRTDAEIRARVQYVRDEVEAELHGLGFTAPDKIYDVYYDGSSIFSCGGSFWPPVLPGNVVAMYLHGTPPGSSACDSNPLPAPGPAPGYWEYAMLHDTLHGLGFVAPCAPHHTRAGHVSDSPSDLMWAGDAPWSFPLTLDVGHDDYWQTGRDDCPDLARSPYLTTAAAPKLTFSKVSFVHVKPRPSLSAWTNVLVDGVAPAAGSTTCTARIGGSTVRGVPGFDTGLALCRFRLTAKARGKRLVGAIGVTIGSVSGSVPFSIVVG
jgi:hypothetical protein